MIKYDADNRISIKMPKDVNTGKCDILLRSILLDKDKKEITVTLTYMEYEDEN